MDSDNNVERVTRRHVVAMPYPGRGHINPMMNLCELLASKTSHDILITIVVTEEWLGFIDSEPKPSNVRFRSIPNVVPSELVRAADFTGFIEAVVTKMEDPFEQLLNQLDPPATAIIYDTLLFWVVGVGNRLKIPVASFWTMSPTVFSFHHHFDLLVQNRHFPISLSDFKRAIDIQDMDSDNNVERVTRRHVVAMPYPGRGHINPMMNLCELLASKTSHDILITIVVTEEWLGFIDSEPKPSNVRFRSIPNVVPSELVRAADFTGFIEAVVTKMEDPFEQLLNQLDPPATTIIYDTLLFWVVGVGNRLKIPVASFWTMSPTVFSFYHHFDLLVQNRHFPISLSERCDEVDYIPGVSPTRLADLPSVFHGSNHQLLYRCLQGFSVFSKIQYVLFPTVSELESQVIDALKLEFPIPIYSIGPSIPYFKLKDNSPSSSVQSDLNYFQWLDNQPSNSVLYVSMGSFLSFSSAQMDEIAAGLRESGVRYLWVARGETSRLKDDCGDMGLVVPWCDQLRVLSHSSIGGFWTHCGWNSTLEGVFAGVPFLTLPVALDQPTNSKIIVEDWKIGLKVKNGVGENVMIQRDDIAELVQRFMDLESGEGKKMRRRARELQDICQQSITEGGSSEVNINAFIRDISLL